MVGLSEGRIAPPANLNVRTIQPQAESLAFRFHFKQYATRRAADWAARGFTETLVDFPTLFKGVEVYLCWKLGEPAIDFWHGIDEGFRGRKPIDKEFLDHHRGDRGQ